MHMRSRGLRDFGAIKIAMVLTLVLALAPDVFADSAVGQFSSTLNPNGNWAYGFTSTLGGAFTPLGSGSCGSLVGWQLSGHEPWVLGNPTASTQVCGTGQVPPTLLDMHPGGAGQDSVVRWTAPSAGTFSINGFFEGIDPAPTTTDVHVLLDGSTHLFDGSIGSFNVPLLFNLTRTLAAGDTIDFAVGVGSDGSFIDDSTGLSATIVSSSTVPEPTTLALLASCLAMLAGFTWRHGRQ
jgi:hypothetical protein